MDRNSSSSTSVLSSKKRRNIKDYFQPSDSNGKKVETPLGVKEIQHNIKIKKRSVGEDKCADKSISNASREEHFEVEEILNYAYCEIQKKGKYLVKWVGWSSKHNTWEPYSNLYCEEKLKEFYFKRLRERERANPSKKRTLELPPDPITHFEKRSEFLDSVFSPPCFSELNKYFQKIQRGEIKVAYQCTPQDLEEMIDSLSISRSKPSSKKLDVLKEQLMLKHIRDTRQSQKTRIKEWEDEINKMERVKITVENETDLEGPPRHMTYITGYLPAQGIVIPNDPPCGCECTSCSLSTEKQCCPNSYGHSFPYTKYRKLRIGIGNPIYECNKRCKCDSSCSNRVVQKGRMIKLCIFRTDNDCGWGVKTLENIKCGSFIVDYAGQVITSEEAEERGKQYDSEGRTYLFDLDFNLGDECPYTVDAANFGNVAHFINHSCDPNLAIFNVWIDCLDPNLPRLCLFAQRDIIKGEQLTFDYCQSTTADNSVSSSLLNKNNRMLCRCGTSKCRKWLFER
ncbi:histone-lysine N-methyltransferase SUV39H2 [Lepeophtheirus salmonis]|uniref:Histone-lysine N-methyltransferase n=1 Tax=Lepeophtheirus salmonis TaxID=72036 RepID=A0A0K2UKZ3_LEPSM|nr:histone-lysine N-methyltransferase SUV39H2-like [Lepeophtheirus salmonis]